MKKQVLIVDDDEEMQLIYGAIFRREPEIEIAGQVSTAEEALGAVRELLPDLVIVDISLPGMSGIDFTKKICESFPKTRVLVVTGHPPDLYGEEARLAGADMMIVKGNAFETVNAVKMLLGLKE